MTINLKKCTLYIKLDKGDGDIKYSIDPVPASVEQRNDVFVYEFDINVSRPPVITISVTDRIGTNSHLVIENIEYNHQKISDLNSVCFLRTENGTIKKNHGYVDSKGEVLIKLHTNPVSLNYLNYLISLTKSH